MISLTYSVICQAGALKWVHWMTTALPPEAVHHSLSVDDVLVFVPWPWRLVCRCLTTTNLGVVQRVIGADIMAARLAFLFRSANVATGLCLPQTPSTGLRHPSFNNVAGKRCSECVSVSVSVGHQDLLGVRVLHYAVLFAGPCDWPSGRHWLVRFADKQHVTDSGTVAVWQAARNRQWYSRGLTGSTSQTVVHSRFDT